MYADNTGNGRFGEPGLRPLKVEYTDEDMANVGRALMERLPDGYSYMNCPSEIVTDLQNEIADLRMEVQEAFDKGYRAAGGTTTPITDLLTSRPKAGTP